MAPWVILSNFLGKIYVQRGLIRNFVVRDLKARYIGSFMGLFWSVIHPIVLLVSYTFVFSVIFRTPAAAGYGNDQLSASSFLQHPALAFFPGYPSEIEHHYYR